METRETEYDNEIGMGLFFKETTLNGKTGGYV